MMLDRRQSINGCRASNNGAGKASTTLATQAMLKNADNAQVAASQGFCAG
jgi:hypothetical protein